MLQNMTPMKPCTRIRSARSTKQSNRSPFNRRLVLSTFGTRISNIKKGTRLAKVTIDWGKQTLIDASGKIFTGFDDDIIINSYSNHQPFSWDVLWGYLNDHGEEAISPIYSSVSKFSKKRHGLCRNLLFINLKLSTKVIHQ